MQYFRHSSIYSGLALVIGCISFTSQAAEAPLSPQDNSIESINKEIGQVRPDDFERLSTELPSEDSGPKMSKEETIIYLSFLFLNKQQGDLI